jgi:hypothetical protein
MMEPFEFEVLAHRLIEVGVRIQATVFAIAERKGDPSIDELVETTERTAREAIRLLDHFRSELVPKPSLPWP